MSDLTNKSGNPQAGDSTTALVLASASPRRKAFLTGAGLTFAVAPVDIREVPRGGEAPVDFAVRMAREKAEASADALVRGGSAVLEGSAGREGTAGRGASAGPGAWVLASDTVVTLEGAILGKPSDPDEACHMLARLAGQTHTVLTAYALHGPGGARIEGLDQTAVRFMALSAAEIAAYVATGEPMDKAGAYGVQGLGGRFVAAVLGDLSTVIGLPIGPVLEALEAAGVLGAEPLLARAARGVRARIAAAADGDGRAASAVRLVAVSKHQPDSAVAAALEAGLADLGENYVQALAARAAAFGSGEGEVGPRWHFIGSLQRNKCKQLLGIPGSVACVHSLDDLRTATALGRAALDLGRVQTALVQVRIGDENSKGGVEPDRLAETLAALESVPGLRIEGLMAVPPASEYGAARRHFAALRGLRDACATAERPLAHLSMGMSDDYQAAIAEGSTCVRVGSALFGARPPKA